MNLLNGCQLLYFNLPGRGEATRLALTIGGISFEDKRIEFSEWPATKPTTPWGSLPVLTLQDGTTQIAQQRAILRFVGKETGLYPNDDNLNAAKMDELLDACEDIGSKTNAAGQGLSQVDKEAARKKSCEEGGTTYNILKKVDTFIAANGSEGYSVGNTLSIADLYVYTSCNNLVAGLYDGVPTDAIDTGFPNISKVRKSVRSHPAVAKHYDVSDKKFPASYGEL